MLLKLLVPNSSLVSIISVNILLPPPSEADIIWRVKSSSEHLDVIILQMELTNSFVSKIELRSLIIEALILEYLAQIFAIVLLKSVIVL